MRKVFFTLLLFLLSATALADTRNISGLLLDVDGLTEMDDGSVEIVINDEPRIIDAADVDDYILNAYFNSTLVQRLPLPAIQKYIERVLRDDDIQHSVLAFKGMMNHPKFKETDAIEFVNSLKDGKFAIPFFQELLLTVDQLKHNPKLTAYLILYVGVKAPRWFADNYKLQGNIDVIKKVFDEHYFADVKENNLEHSKRLLLFEKQLFGEDDVLFKKHAIINEQITNALSGLRKNDLSGMKDLIVFINRDAESEKILSPVISDNLHSFIRKAIATERFQDSLSAFSLINPDWRTETTHRLLIETFQKIKEKNIPVDITVAANTFFQTLSQKDSSVKSNYLDCLTVQFKHLLSNGDFGRANLMLSYILALRPDPNEENNLLRSEEVLEAYHSGNFKLAEEFYKEIKTSLPVTDRVWIFLSSSYYRHPIFFMLVGLVILLLPFLYGICNLKIVGKLRGKEDINKAPPDIQTESIDDSMSEFRKQSAKHVNTEQEKNKEHLFVSQAGDYVSAAKQKFKEYHECVKELGVPQDADMKLIKATYRSKVKDFHPDLHPDQPKENADKFLRIQEVYKKLIKLRAELGLPE